MNSTVPKTRANPFRLSRSPYKIEKEEYLEVSTESIPRTSRRAPRRVQVTLFGPTSLVDAKLDKLKSKHGHTVVIERHQNLGMDVSICVLTKPLDPKSK